MTANAALMIATNFSSLSTSTLSSSSSTAAKLKTFRCLQLLARAPKRPYQFQTFLRTKPHQIQHILHFGCTRRITNMAAATQLDEKAQILVEKSYPQAKGADSDPAKLSSAIFSSVEVRCTPT